MIRGKGNMWIIRQMEHFSKVLVVWGSESKCWQFVELK
jgi:hypothetical protein